MKKMLFILLFLIVAIKSIAQTSWYVSTTGIDFSSGGTFANPFATITYASSKLSAGDTLFVMGGTYKNADFDATNIWGQTSTVRISNLNGSPTQYITIKPYQNQPVIIKGDGPYLFLLRISSYIRIEGFTIEGELNNIPLDSAKKYQFIYKDNAGTIQYRVPPGTPDAQIATMTFIPISGEDRPARFTGQGLVLNSCHHINIYNCVIKNVPGAGLRLQACDYINVVANKISNCTRRTSIGNPGFVLSYLNSIDNNTGVKIYLARNEVFDNYNEVYSWTGSKTFINPIIDEGKGMSVEHCITRLAPQESWKYGRIKFENNICYGNGFSGLNTNEGERVDFINNTVYNNTRSARGQNTGISVNNGFDVTIKNNIAVSVNNFGGYAIAMDNFSTGVVMQKNLILGSLDPALSSIQQSTSYGDPLFVDSINRNFNLKIASPAINNAIISGAPIVDFYNKTRDALPDLGAIEYAQSLPTTLLYFSGKEENSFVKFEWQTANETNLLNFELQQSINSQDWNTINTISPILNNAIICQYFYQTKIVSEPIVYYRLVVVDKDNQRISSKIIKLANSIQNGFSVFPNPCKDFVLVKSDVDIDEKSIKFFDVAGCDLSSKTSIQKMNNCSLKIMLSNIPQGNYILSINNFLKIISKLN